MISDSPGDNEDGDEQDDDHAWFGSSKLVDGLQTPEPSFQTIQCRSKPGSPTGWGPALDPQGHLPKAVTCFLAMRE